MQTAARKVRNSTMPPSPVRLTTRDGRIDQVASERLEPRQNPVLVGSRKPRIADDVGHQDRGQFAGFAHRAPLGVATLAQIPAPVCLYPTEGPPMCAFLPYRVSTGKGRNGSKAVSRPSTLAWRSLATATGHVFPWRPTRGQRGEGNRGGGSRRGPLGAQNRIVDLSQCTPSARPYLKVRRS